MNKYKAQISTLTDIKEEEQTKIDNLNAQILYHIASQEGIKKDIKSVVAEIKKLENIKNTKEDYATLIRKTILGDIKVGSLIGLGYSLSILVGACISSGISVCIRPLALLITLIISCIGGGLSVALDDKIPHLREINENYDVEELDASINDKKAEEQELQQSQVDHQTQARELQESKKQKQAFITEVDKTIDMLKAQLNALIEAILTQNEQTINDDFMVKVEEEAIKRLLAKKEGN
ncbi:MAG: hypothetical protein K2J20_00775 [Bacilli bacterium]|nr:hypothetical protein [Bacilli bacterium]